MTAGKLIAAGSILLASGCFSTEPEPVARREQALHEDAVVEVDDWLERRRYIIELLEEDEQVELFENGYGIRGPVLPDAAPREGNLWYALLSDVEVEELIAKGIAVELEEMGELDGLEEFAPDGLGPTGGGCPNATPANGTFCRYDTVSTRCATPIKTELEGMPASHPPINGQAYVAVVDAGESQVDSRRIKGVRIGKIVTAGGTVPQLVVFSAQHSNEWLGPEMSMRLARYFADSYQANVDGVRPLLSDRALVIVPVANPDGYQYSHTNSRSWRKNRFDCGGGNVGVDPNRNLPLSWGLPGSQAGCVGTTGRGNFAESEDESTALRVLLSDFGLPGPYRTVFALNVHTIANVIAFAEGLSANFAPCTTNSNCSAPDLGALYSLVGTEADPWMRDQDGSNRAYVTDQGFRALYALSGDAVVESVYGTHLGNVPDFLAATVELTNTDCVHETEKLTTTQLADLFETYKEFVRHLLEEVDDLYDDSYWTDTVGNYAQPHIHRRTPTNEFPRLRVAARTTIGAVVMDGPAGFDGATAADDVRDGVAYRMWRFTADTPYTFPHRLPLCSTEGCRDIVIEGDGGGGFNLCDVARWSQNGGWTFVPQDPAAGSQDDCYWRLSGGNPGPPFQLTSIAKNLTTIHGNHLTYSVSRTTSPTAVVHVQVSSNNFQNCSPEGFGTCRVVRSHPYDNANNIRTGAYRTEILDITDFDGQAGVRVRFQVDSTPIVNPNTFRVYDAAILGFAD